MRKRTRTFKWGNNTIRRKKTKRRLEKRPGDLYTKTGPERVYTSRE